MFLKNTAMSSSLLGAVLVSVPVVAFTPQPPVARQAVQGVNPQNLTQTFFFAAQSNTLTNGIPDVFQLSFQIGSFFGPPFAPSEFYIVVSGSKAGVEFAEYLLAPGDTISTTDYSGNWGLGSYEGTTKWESAVAKVDSPAQKVTGSLSLKKSTGPPAWACGPGTGTNLESLITKSSTPAEIAMYKNTNWGHFALGQAHVKANINGTILDFTGPFEAETSYGPPYEDTYSRFIYGFTTVGPFDIAFWQVAPPGEPTKYATIGYLSEHGRLVVNECNTIAQRPTAITLITPTGTRDVPGLPFPVPQGLEIDFTGKNGEKYNFKYDTAGEQASTLPIGSYINGLGTVTGGCVGGKQYTGNAEVQYFVTPGTGKKPLDPHQSPIPRKHRAKVGFLLSEPLVFGCLSLRAISRDFTLRLQVSPARLFCEITVTIAMMEDQEAAEPDNDLQIQQILLAASQHNIPELRTLLRTGSASVQDPETGFTPLHAAIAACETPSSPTQNGVQVNGYVPNGNPEETQDEESVATHDEEIHAAAKTMKLLLENGAIWNDVDNNNETPGCLALRLGLKELYKIMVDAGVRAEILLNRLDEYEQLDDCADEDAGEDDSVEEERAAAEVPQDSRAQATSQTGPVTDAVERAEINNEDFLRSSLDFQNGRILDDPHNGVMMAWETDIMKRTADLLVPGSGLRILNIGHGMGIIDNFFQAKSPRAHHIIEAHPAVLAQMRGHGWFDKPGVTVHEGKWQEIIPKIMEQAQMFDAIYFDTFAEDYKALRDFFSDYVLGLLEDGGKWGFFNGLGADRQICYDVYGKVVEMDLFEAGFDTDWETLQVPNLEENDVWKDVRRRYWTLKEYKLPICYFTG